MRPQLEAAPDGPSADTLALQRIAAGEITALDGLYDRHAQAMMKFATRIVGRADAEDLLHATFVRAASIAKGYDTRSDTARGWLIGVMAKLAQERRRARARFGRAVNRLSVQPHSNETPRATERLAIERALARLTAQKRVVLVLAEVQGYTCEQIAEMLSIPVGTVWTRLHHAKKELRALLDAEPA